MKRQKLYSFFFGLLLLLTLPLSLQAQRPPKGGGKAYKAAEIYTLTDYLYGKVEFRMRAAKGSGILSNFFTWKEGSEQTNVAWEEIDIEVFGKNNAQTWQSNIITGLNTRITSEQVHSYNYSLGDAYHTYTLEWTPTAVVWYVDGVETRRTTGGQVAQLISRAQLRFNFWPANIPDWAGAFDDSILPVYMFVSWIKYYRYENGSFVLDWQDTFDSFNSARWGKANWTFTENLADFDPNNALTNNGKLVLAMTRSGATGFSGTAPSDPEDTNPSGGGGGSGDTQPPTTPGKITITYADACSAGLSWVASTDNVGVTGYRVYVGGALHLTTTGTTAIVTGLTANAQYLVEVSAVDAAGNESGRSAQYVRTKSRGCSGARALSTEAGQPSVVYPVPAQSVVYIQNANPIQNVELFTVQGQRINVRSSGDTYTWQLQTEGIAPGLYLLRIHNANGQQEVQRVIIGD